MGVQLVQIGYRPAISAWPAYAERLSIMGEFTDKAKGLGNEIAGNAKQVAGDATDNDNLKAEGAAQERKGEAQNLKGKVNGALGDKI
jgi:uncharacterized protein YjbJ (UPF0337 family)